MLHMRDQIQACPMFLTSIPALEAPKPESVSLSQGEATTPTELNSGAWRRSAMTWRLRRILCEWMWSTLKAKSPFHYIMIYNVSIPARYDLGECIRYPSGRADFGMWLCTLCL